jgi:hypothetical protein
MGANCSQSSITFVLQELKLIVLLEIVITFLSTNKHAVKIFPTLALVLMRTSVFKDMTLSRFVTMYYSVIRTHEELPFTVLLVCLLSPFSMAFRPYSCYGFPIAGVSRQLSLECGNACPAA